jgi:radical SAM superfamily enzyme YgiQ (UPF0313 family)
MRRSIKINERIGMLQSLTARGGSQVIDAMDRRINVSQMREMIKLTKGIEAGTFIMKLPGETERDIEETIYYLKKSNPDHFTITVAQ